MAQLHELIGNAKQAEPSSTLRDRVQEESITYDEIVAALQKISKESTAQLKRHGLNEENLRDALSIVIAEGATKETQEQFYSLLQNIDQQKLDLLTRPQQVALAYIGDTIASFNLTLKQGYGFRAVEDSAFFSAPKTLEGPRLCGPRACHSLINANGILSTDDFLGANFEQLNKGILEHCQPTLIGINPKNITQALEAVAKPRSFDVAITDFKNSGEAINYIKDNLPVLVKLGASLTSQHYTTITRTMHEDGRGYMLTAYSRTNVGLFT